LGQRTALFSSMPSRRLRGLATVLALVCLMVAPFVAPSSALAQNRTLSLYNTHTHERLTVTYKRNGRFVQSALDQLNRFLRDWRRDEVARIDPELFDVVWSVYREVGATEPIHVVSAYRSPATNDMLRRRSSGVANNSQHTQGRAMDFFIPGIPASQIRAAGLRLQEGGVGYYPRSNTPFVHLDTGSVRMWPRMTRTQLQALFPDGRTVHIPSDGRPLAGFEQARRELERRGPATVRVASASASSSSSDDSGSTVLPDSQGGGLLAALFGGGEDDEEDVASAPVQASSTVSAPAEVAALAPTEVASAPRERLAPPAPTLPPYAVVDGPSLAPSTIAGLVVPSPVPAPTIDDIQIAALSGQTNAPLGAIAPSATAFATSAEPLPPITREQQIAQTVPQPGQIAAIIEARFAERRAAEASVVNQVNSAFDVANTAPQAETLEALRQAAARRQGSAQPGAIQAPQTLLPSPAPGIVTASAEPRFVPPAPQPTPLALASANTDDLPIPVPATAFAQPEPRLPSAASPAQDAIAAATAAAGDPARATGQRITGQLFPLAGDVSPALAKHSIRSSVYAGLVRPDDTVSLSPVVVHASSFVPTGTFNLQSDQFVDPRTLDLLGTNQ
jgi:uncharacterized protein YcbK (DUF882 family)